MKRAGHAGAILTAGAGFFFLAPTPGLQAGVRRNRRTDSGARRHRGLGTASNVIRHGPLTLDAGGRVVYLNEQMVELSARELSLLEVLGESLEDVLWSSVIEVI